MELVGLWHTVEVNLCQLFFFSVESSCMDLRQDRSELSLLKSQENQGAKRLIFSN